MKGICLIYESLLSRGFVSFPLQQASEEKIEAIISNINNPFFGEEIYSTTEQKVVAYLYFLIKDHPFTDGNKRTAILSFSLASELNQLEINKAKYPLDEIAVFIEKIQENDHQSVIKTLANNIFK